MKHLIILLLFFICFENTAQVSCEQPVIIEAEDLSSLKLSNPISYVKVLKDSSQSSITIKGNYKRVTVLEGENCSSITSSKTIDSSGQFIPSPQQRDQGYCYCETCIQSLSKIKFHEQNYVLLKIEGGTSLSVSAQKKEIKKSTEWYDKQYMKGDKIQLNNIMFYAGTAKLQRESFADLDLLLKVLKNNKTIRVEIQGHVNGPRMKNKKEFQILSEDRAKTVRAYLVKKGINESRLTSNGYGNTRMIFPTAESEFRMQFNRRVEILVL